MHARHGAVPFLLEAHLISRKVSIKSLLLHLTC